MTPRTRNTTSRVEVVFELLGKPRPGTEFAGLVAAAAEAALAAEHSAGPDRVTVLLTGDERLRELNLEFNGLDEVTDVLSFNETGGWNKGVPPTDLERFPGRARPRLGDVIISLPQVARQAATAKVKQERELAMLTIHGVLHLLGYDHATPADERVMFGKTEVILDSVMAASTPLLAAGRKPAGRTR